MSQINTASPPPQPWHIYLSRHVERTVVVLLESSWLIVALTILAFWIDGRYIYTNRVRFVLEGWELALVLAKSFFRDLMGSVALIGGVSLLPRRVLSCVRWGVFVLFSLLYWYEATILHQSNLLHGYTTLQSAGGTNPQEAIEYLSSIDIRSLYPSVVVYLLILCGVFLCRRIGISLGRVARSGILCIYLCIWLAVGVLCFFQIKHYTRVVSEAQVILTASSPIERLVWNTYGYMREAEAVAHSLEKLSSVEIGSIEIDEANRLLPADANLVVIVGESLGRRYMHCYGYPLDNTPHLDSLIFTGDMVRYTDAVSPACWTIGSLTRTLSLYDNDRVGDWTDYPTLMSVLGQLYPQVEWMSAQESYGSYVQPLILLANTSSRTRYTSAFSNDDSYRRAYYDEELLPLIPSLDELAQGRACHFYHLMGSHQRYDLRCPAEWSKFVADSIPRDDLSLRERGIIAHYMNSVYYNDYVVSEIIRRYAHTSSMVVYFSDHGEVLYDDPSNPTYASHSLTTGTAEIPLLVYVSPELQRKAPKLYERVKASADYPIMMDTFADALLGILGVKSKYTNPSANFWSDDYDPNRVRIVHGTAPGETLVYKPEQ